jgi:hypothetical protein
MKEIVAKTYFYFLLKKLPTPYFRTIMIFCGFTVLHFFIIFEIFPLPEWLDPFRITKIPIRNYIAGAFFFGLIFLILSFCFKRKDIAKYSFTERQMKYFMPKMLLYFVFLFITLIILSTMHLRDKW